MLAFFAPEMPMPPKPSKRLRTTPAVSRYCRLANSGLYESDTFYDLCEELGVAKSRGFRLGKALRGRHIYLCLDEMEKMVAQLPSGFGFEWTGQSREEKLSGSQATILLARYLTATNPAEARKLLDPLMKISGPVGQVALQAYGEIGPQ